MAKKEPKNYKEAWKELQGILEDLDDGKMDIDKLATNVKRASILVEYCQTKLRDVESELSDELAD